MPTTITGDSGAAYNGISRLISGATNASPIVITTSTAHFFATGDSVLITDVEGNTAANDLWKITKISSTTFSLDGSTGSGAYTSGGTAVDLSLTPQFQAPADGDNLDAASVNSAFEALADRTQFLALAHAPRIWVPGCEIRGVSGTARAASLDGTFNPITATEAIYSASALKTTSAIAGTHATNTWHLLLPLDAYLRTGQGRTLATATLYFTPDDTNLGTPSSRLRFGIGRQVLTTDAFAIPDAPEPLLSTGSGFATDAQAGTYNLVLHKLTFVPDQNEVIDTTRYGYVAIIPLSHDTLGDYTYAIHGIQLAFA